MLAVPLAIRTHNVHITAQFYETDHVHNILLVTEKDEQK